MIELIAILVMIVGYGVAIVMIARIFMIAYTLHTDVPFVPTDKRLLEAALKCMNIQDGDLVVDLGSGDGRFILYAAKRYPKAKFVGVELNKGLVIYSKIRAKLRFTKNVTFLQGDVFEYDVSKVDKIYLYMTTGFIARLLPKLVKELPKGSMILSSHFGFGKEFEAKNNVIHEYLNKKKKEKISYWVK